MKKFLLRALLALALGLGAVFALSTPALALGAQVVDPGEGGGVVFVMPTILQALTVVNIVVWPLLVGLVSNSSWSSLAKYLLHAALTALGTLTAEWADAAASGTPYNITDAMIAAVIAFGLSVLAYKTVGQAKTKKGNSLASTLANTGNVSKAEGNAG